MAETRARPARERQRFHLIIRANWWFYARMSKVEDPSWEMIRDWEECDHSLKIRRFNNANPQTATDQGEDDRYPDAKQEQETMDEVMAPPLHPES